MVTPIRLWMAVPATSFSVPGCARSASVFCYCCNRVAYIITRTHTSRLHVHSTSPSLRAIDIIRMSSSLPPYLEFLPQCKVLVCQVHAYCFTRADIAQHLEQLHGTSPEDCEKVSQAARALDVALTRGHIPYTWGPTPIKGLEVSPGILCVASSKCGWLGISTSSFRGHLSKKHGIAGSERNSELLSKNIDLQCLFPGSRKPAYNIVGPDDPSPSSPGIAPAQKKRRRRKSTHQPAEEIMEPDEGEDDDDDEEGVSESEVRASSRADRAIY